MKQPSWLYMCSLAGSISNNIVYTITVFSLISPAAAGFTPAGVLTPRGVSKG